MFVATTPPSPPAITLAPVGLIAEAPTEPVRTTLRLGHAQLNVLAGHPATVSGTLRPGLAGKPVLLQRLTRHGWRTIQRGHTGTRGRFRLRYIPRQTGSGLIRVRFAGDAIDAPSSRRVGTLNVFRVAIASWYGGGGQTACGASLTSSTLGVANKTLPCGTIVMLRYGGHTLRVPVIDRGPFVAGREFDLTEATKYALGFGDVGALWSTR